MTAAERALDFIRTGDCIGLGTGRAASSFVRALAARVAEGLDVRAVATSDAMTVEARALGIPLTTLEQVEHLDLTVDGADEVDPQLDLIKGYGGALLRERVVGAASKRRIIIVGAEKRVPVLGTRGALPVEVVPFALPVCRRELAALGLTATARMDGDRAFTTDNGNYLLHVAVGPIADPGAFLARLRAIPGVVDAGLFIGFADTVLVQVADHVVLLERDSVRQPDRATPRAPVNGSRELTP